MTREEALRRVKGYLTDIIPAEDYSEVEKILKALEPETCDDAISRQYLLDCVVDKVTMPYVPVSKIENAPSVTPQQKMGHWIRVDKNKLRCSECEIIHLIAQYPNGKIDWCPNCGTRMERLLFSRCLS